MKRIFIIIFIFLFYPVEAQENFVIENNKEKFTLPFVLVNDLVIVTVKLNGVELSFLLDSGVDQTILFSLKPEDSMELKNTKSIYFRGLGAERAIRAMQSEGNEMQIGNAFNKNLDVFIIFESEMNLSTRMGVPIHGIIGYDFFKDFVIKINYQNRRMKVYDPARFKYRKCRRCSDLEIVLQKNKPFIQVAAEVNDKDSKQLNLLVDSGSGDAIWLFQNSKNNLRVPGNSFPDFLGYSLSGSVHGFRSRIPALKIGKFEFEKITASFPDTSYTEGIDQLINRDGSLGSKILKRFHVYFDYKNGRIRLKPNRSFDEPFEYDMSGVVVAHAGYAYVKEFNDFEMKISTEENFLLQKTHQPKFSLKPQYTVVEVRDNSPAQLAGLQTGDNLLTINGKAAYNFSLSKIIKILSSEDGKTIKMKIERNGIEKTISFELDRIL